MKMHHIQYKIYDRLPDGESILTQNYLLAKYEINFYRLEKFLRELKKNKLIEYHREYNHKEKITYIIFTKYEEATKHEKL